MNSFIKSTNGAHSPLKRVQSSLVAFFGHQTDRQRTSGTLALANGAERPSILARDGCPRATLSSRERRNGPCDGERAFREAAPCPRHSSKESVGRQRDPGRRGGQRNQEETRGPGRRSQRLLRVPLPSALTSSSSEPAPRVRPPHPDPPPAARGEGGARTRPLRRRAGRDGGAAATSRPRCRPSGEREPSSPRASSCRRSMLRRAPRLGGADA